MNRRKYKLVRFRHGQLVRRRRSSHEGVVLADVQRLERMSLPPFASKHQTRAKNPMRRSGIREPGTIFLAAKLERPITDDGDAGGPQPIDLIRQTPSHRYIIVI